MIGKKKKIYTSKFPLPQHPFTLQNVLVPSSMEGTSNSAEVNEIPRVKVGNTHTHTHSLPPSPKTRRREPNPLAAGGGGGGVEVVPRRRSTFPVKFFRSCKGWPPPLRSFLHIFLNAHTQNFFKPSSTEVKQPTPSFQLEGSFFFSFILLKFSKRKLNLRGINDGRHVDKMPYIYKERERGRKFKSKRITNTVNGHRC